MKETQTPKDQLWRFTHLKQWRITATLEAQTPLHIGNGDVHEATITDSQGKPREIKANSFIMGKGGRPIIPGSSIKGKLRAHLEPQLDDGLLDRVFGEGHESETEQGKGGLAEFHDAPLVNECNGTGCYPYWNPERQTFIEAATAIDRHTRTALDNSLHYTECVAPGSQFDLTITGAMGDDQAAVLISALRELASKTNIINLGAEEANDKGKMEVFGDTEVCRLDHGDILGWLDGGSEANRASTAYVKLGKDILEELCLGVASRFESIESRQNDFGISLQFEGPFIVNDPSKKTGAKHEPNHQPLTDKEGNPNLPARSFRGAIRSQAERIIRTLGGNCCDTSNPCGETEGRCLACEMFGATGWKTTVNISAFDYQGEKRPFIEQPFVAIDRFHGGGKDTALFSAFYADRPTFKGVLALDTRGRGGAELAWRKGLLGLIFRDLKEGDITFGFGASKGYGKIEGVIIEPEGQITDADIEAFRKKCKQSSVPWTCGEVETPQAKSGVANLQPVAPATDELQKFHNPYHFIPTKTPDTSTWSNKEYLKKSSSPHSHAFYRNRTDNGGTLHHGRIICKLTAETPFFIGAGDADDTQQGESEAKLKENYRLSGELGIPATSLRGMISALAEAASNSAMRVLDDGFLSYRKTAGHPLKQIGMIFEGENGDQRVIPMENNAANAIKLKNAYGPSKKPEMERFIQENHSWSPEHNVVYYLRQNFEYGDVPESNYSPGMICGILRILGKDENRKNELENKKHELFIKIDSMCVDTKENAFYYDKFMESRQSLKVDTQAVTRYQSLANQRSEAQKNNSKVKDDDDCVSTKWQPFHLKGSHRKKKDKYCMLPLSNYALVYFASENNTVTEIAFSAIWRDAVKGTVNAFVPKELRPMSKQRKVISPAELLFGFTEINDTEEKYFHALGYAGKVRIGAGTLSPAYQGSDNLLDNEIMLKALSSPKLPSPALYFRKRPGVQGYIAKSELNSVSHRIQGRKFYLHAERKEDEEVQKLSKTGISSNNSVAKYPWETHDENQKPALKVRIRPIKKQTSFYFQLNFNNLTAWELGLLCYTLRPTSEFRHKLGMGKPIGLGSVKIDIAALQTINRKKRYEDSLTEPRYNGVYWADPELQDEIEKTYKIDQHVKPELDPNKLRNGFISTMDSDIYRAIELLGTPQNVRHAVHYPQVRGENIEEENFKWFVANDSGSGSGASKIGAAEESLKPITADSVTIPTLNRHRWNG